MYFRESQHSFKNVVSFIRIKKQKIQKIVDQLDRGTPKKSSKYYYKHVNTIK